MSDLIFCSIKTGDARPIYATRESEDKIEFGTDVVTIRAIDRTYRIPTSSIQHIRTQPFREQE